MIRLKSRRYILHGWSNSLDVNKVWLKNGLSGIKGKFGYGFE